MYAIFETGGKQYKVEAGDVLRIEKIQDEEGKLVKFGNVIAFSEEEGKLLTGTPYLDAATVNATVLSAGKGSKVIIFKFKSKKDYRKKQGHRQPYTEIEIENFTVGGKTVGKKPEKPVKEEEEKAEEETEAKAETAEIKEEAKEKKPAKGKATAKADAPDEDKADKAEVPAKKEKTAEKVKAEEPAKEEKAEEKPADAAKQTKADIMTKLDELGVEYLKSAKKDELLALLENAGNK